MRNPSARSSGSVGIALGEDRLTGVGQEVAELPPRGAVDDLLGDLVHLFSLGVAPSATRLAPVVLSDLAELAEPGDEEPEARR